jgi:hypothetical protein
MVPAISHPDAYMAGHFEALLSEAIAQRDVALLQVARQSLLKDHSAGSAVDGNS